MYPLRNRKKKIEYIPKYIHPQLFVLRESLTASQSIGVSLAFDIWSQKGSLIYSRRHEHQDKLDFLRARSERRWCAIRRGEGAKDAAIRHSVANYHFCPLWATSCVTQTR